MDSRSPYYSQKSVYLDHNATTPPHPEVVARASQWLSVWGNPSSIHWAGRDPKNVMRDTRKKLAQILNISPLEIIFTSGGSESNNTVLKAVFEQAQRQAEADSKVTTSNRVSYRHEILISSVEHPSLMKTAEFLASQGAVIRKIPVLKNGFVDMQAYQALLSEKTLLVSCMLANNEVGSLFPIQEMARLAHAQGALFHSDCVQAFGKIPLNLKELNIDYATFSAHKVYALKGLGFTFVKKNSPYVPLIHGGGQERHRRGGTENIHGVAALGVVCDFFSDLLSKQGEIKQLRDHFEKRALTEIQGLQISASESERIKNTSHLLIDGVDGETLLMSLDLMGYAVSTGAACSSGNPEPSPVMLAMGFTREEAQKSLRVSFGLSNTLQEVDLFIEALKEVVARLRAVDIEMKVKNELHAKGDL